MNMHTLRPSLGRLLSSAALLFGVAAAAPAPAQENVLRVVVPSSIEAKIPSGTGPAFNQGLLRNVFETLTVVSPDQKLLPGLATDWSVSDDKLTWTFRLREGVSFTDGTPFDADAVVRNIDYIMAPENRIPSLDNLGPLSGARKVDDHTVELTTSVPFSGLPVRLAHTVASMVSPASYDEYGADIPREIASGTGPFMLESFELPDRIVMTRNPDYWGGAPEIDGIDFDFINDGQTRLAGLLSGQADMNFYLSPIDRPRVAGNPDFEVLSVPSIRAFVAHLPMGLPAMQDRKVREALNLAIDREALANFIFSGSATALDSSIGPGQIGYRAAHQLPYDPERAEELFAEAGWSKNSDGILEKDGERFPTLTYLASNGRYPGDDALAQAVSGYLTEAGVPTELRIEEFATFIEDARNTARDAGWVTQIAWGFASEGASMLCQVYVESNPLDFGGYDNPELETACAEIDATFETDARIRLIEETAAWVMDDYPAIFLLAPTYEVATSTAFTGLQLSSSEYHSFAGVAPAE
ncbi:ABC transporter substrate-binding protein [Celeribacter indicus]|uniref:Extracellular solute-binding protein n=1 Tax=Celeribacter indicus TaxID=1208324 RepID=A0A0B5DUL7_9RHOB|nr:ABC transporter substrate-binding protein [Celeribacter indicus]AJE46714.1 extracellular solute-binding protein [Celeribacter indicus]SDX04614.1 peptide/nickel transport system substrate-binding protein [Celeribacter indicus]